MLDADTHPGHDTIRFNLGKGDHTITLTGGELPVTDDLTIDGPGAGRLTISGNDASRVFDVKGAGTVHPRVDVRDLTVSHGMTTEGGAILNDGGRLTLEGVVLSDNKAVGGDGTAGGGAGGDGLGGAVANEGGSLTVLASQIFNNLAQGVGGAAYIAGGTAAIDVDTVFIGNSASTSNPDVFGTYTSFEEPEGHEKHRDRDDHGDNDHGDQGRDNPDD